MTAAQKEVLYQKWNRCDRSTRIRIACEYLKKLRSGGEKINWLTFLANSLEDNR